MITKILVGIDGSENSEKALDEALEIADKFDASVLILNVFQPPPETGYQLNMFAQSQTPGYAQEPTAYQPNIAASINDLRKVHEEVLLKATERATKLNPTLKITSELKEGDTSAQIVETAANGKFDLIVVGHKGNSEIREFFLGSTSERVVHRAKCNILITS